MAINEKRPRTNGGGRSKKEGGANKNETGSKSKSHLKSISTKQRNGSSTNLKAASSGRMAKLKSSSSSRIGMTAVGGNSASKNALGSRNRSIEPQGLSIAFRMALIFGLLIAAMVLFSILVLNEFMKGKLKEEVKASGVKSTLLLGLTGQVIAKFEDIMIKESIEQNTKVELNAYYKRIAAELNKYDVNILCVSIRDPKDRKQAIFSSFDGYGESDFDSEPTQVVSGVEIKSGFFLRNIDGTRVSIPTFKFESEILDAGKRVGYSVIYISFQNVKEATDRITKIAVVVAAFGAIIGLGVAWVFARSLSEPLLRLVRDIQIVAEGDLDHKTKARSRDEIGVLALTFNKMTENLRYQKDLEADAVTRDIELSHAKDIQQRLLPRNIPNLKGFEFHQIYISAKEVGGDYYDIMPVDDSNIALLVADVSGKGIPGSMVMAETRTILRIIRTHFLSTKKVMTYANRHLAEDIKPGMFVTMMYCILNLKDKTMLVSSAGHNPLMIQRATGEFIKLNPKGIALGFDKGPIFERVIAEQKIQLMQGDRVVMYTDGVVESMNPNREEYGEDRLEEFVQRNSKLSSKGFVDKLMADVHSHQGAAEQHDDITILTFKVLG